MAGVKERRDEPEGLPTKQGRLRKVTALSLIILLCAHANCFPQEPSSTIKNSLDMEMVKIDSGSFTMGGDITQAWTDEDEVPAFTCKITKPYWIQSTEVTRGMFEQFCSSTGYVTEMEREQNRSGLGTINTWRDDRMSHDRQFPVVMVSFDDATAFCVWLSGREGETYRLPTEPEWEFACRAGATHCVSDASDILERCRENCIGRSEIQEILALNPVARSQLWKCGSGKPNSFGLYDMHGNAGELVDGYHLPYSKGVIQPSRVFFPDPTAIVTRGGSYKSGPEDARCSSRMWMKRSAGTESIGFRVVLERDQSRLH